MHETEGNLMRKFLAVAAVAVLALAVAVPAMALDFKFGGEYRVRFYTYANAGFTELPGSNPRGAQVRIRPRFDASDDNGNITATLRLEIGDVEFGNGGGAGGPAAGWVYNPLAATPTAGGTFGTAGVAGGLFPGGARVGPGSGGSFGNDGIYVETKWAYIVAAFPFGVPLRVRAGLQGWYLPKGILVDDDVAGVRFYGTTAPVSYELSWYRPSGGPVTNTAPPTTFPTASPIQTSTSNAFDNNFDFYNGKVDFALAKWLNVGAYAGYGRNGSNPVDPTGLALAGAGGGPVKTWTYYGLSLTGDLGFMKYDFDFVGGRANGLFPVVGVCPAGTPANCVDALGYGFDAGVHFPIGPVVLNAGFSLFTGDKQNGGKSEMMPFIAPSWNGPGNLMWEMLGAAGTFDPVDLSQDFPGGTWAMGVSAEYRPVKALWLRLAYGYMSFTQNDSNCAVALNARAGVPNTCFGPAYTRLAVDGTGTAARVIKETGLGHEISVRADYDVWTGFKVQGAFGFLIPSSGDTTLEMVLQMLYNF
jgi:hypothetical protein